MGAMTNVTKDAESINLSPCKPKSHIPNLLQKLDTGKSVQSQHMYKTLKSLMSWLIIDNEVYVSNAIMK